MHVTNLHELSYAQCFIYIYFMRTNWAACAARPCFLSIVAPRLKTQMIADIPGLESEIAHVLPVVQLRPNFAVMECGGSLLLRQKMKLLIHITVKLDR